MMVGALAAVYRSIYRNNFCSSSALTTNGEYPRPDRSAASILMVQPYPAEAMEATEVSTAVNITRNNGPDLIRPASA